MRLGVGSQHHAAGGHRLEQRSSDRDTAGSGPRAGRSRPGLRRQPTDCDSSRGTRDARDRTADSARAGARRNLDYETRHPARVERCGRPRRRRGHPATPASRTSASLRNRSSPRRRSSERATKLTTRVAPGIVRPAIDRGSSVPGVPRRCGRIGGCRCRRAGPGTNRGIRRDRARAARTSAVQPRAACSRSSRSIAAIERRQWK